MTREPDDEERCPSGKGRHSDIPGVSSLSRLSSTLSSSTLSLPSKQSIVVKPVPGVSPRRTKSSPCLPQALRPRALRVRLQVESPRVVHSSTAFLECCIVRGVTITHSRSVGRALEIPSPSDHPHLSLRFSRIDPSRTTPISPYVSPSRFSLTFLPPHTLLQGRLRPRPSRCSAAVRAARAAR